MLRSGIWEESKNPKSCLMAKRLEDYQDQKSFRPRLTSGSYIFINFCLGKNRKQPYFDKDSAGMEDGEGRLRKGISET